MTGKPGFFVENFDMVPEQGVAEHLFNCGFTFLILPNFQVDLSAGIGLNEYVGGNLIGFGLTYRLSK